jgi:FMN phosphatase YigB (HAD superfamily)
VANFAKVVSPFQAILDYELSLGIPPGWVNYSISRTAPDGFWHRLEKGQIPMDHSFFAGFNRDLHDPARWAAFYRTQQARNPDLPKEGPPLPKLDGEWLFNEMMTKSNRPDPWMFPALQKLRASGRYILAALSNTVIFPLGHVLYQEKPNDNPVRALFDTFISSAHVGLRKPDPEIYKLAVKTADEYARSHADSERGRRHGWSTGIVAGDILFLDDIGENFKAGQRQGFQTIKVHLGRAFEAVDRLEEITGLSLAGDHPRIPIKPDLNKPKARI